MAPRILLPLLALTLAGAARAQQAPDAPRRTAYVGRIDPHEAPVVDGHLEDPCWQRAPAIGELVMVEPWVGREPTERTVVKLLHDRHHLYFAIWCYDRDPDSMRATQRARDARLDPDDRVEILLDPFENRRTGYFFQIGAGGSIGDILISANGARFDKPWDTVWSGAAHVTAIGWVAEIAIPFRSLPRREGAATWGFNLNRQRRSANEVYQWANASLSESFYRASECGTIDGFGEIDAGVGLELVPYTTVGASRDRTAGDDGFDHDVDAGGELYYRLTPSVTVAATVFTDFAETEDDGRQINLNRFPLFFPEKRDFFLQGVSYFSFGASDAGGATFLPFFTRRVGLAPDGSQIPLLGGVKLTGEAGPFEIGLLDVQADSTTVVDEENLAVARLRYALDEQTTVGLLGTHGNPASTGDNTVLGADFTHREPRFVGDMDLRIAVDVVGSTGEGTSGDGESFGLDVQSEGREWQLAAGTRWVAEDFDPALGFVRRRGTRASLLTAAYRPRWSEGSSVRRLLFGVALDRSDTWEGETQDVGFRVEEVGVELHSGDEVALFANRAFERVDSDFTLFRGTTTVFAGDYWATRSGVSVQTSEGRPWNALLLASTGDFFDGRSDRLESTVEWRTSPFLHLGMGYDTADVDLGPGRAFTTHVASSRVDFHFSPHVSLRNLVQFDNESNVLGWQSRLRWIYSPGCDFFAVLGTSWLREGESIAPAEQALELKISQSLRF